MADIKNYAEKVLRGIRQDARVVKAEKALDHAEASPTMARAEDYRGGLVDSGRAHSSALGQRIADASFNQDGSRGAWNKAVVAGMQQFSNLRHNTGADANDAVDENGVTPGGHRPGPDQMAMQARPMGGMASTGGESGAAGQDQVEPLPAPAPPSEGLSSSSQMLDNLHHVSFDYKPGYGTPGRNHGIIAQDLEKSPMGQTLLAPPDQSGVKKVDLTKATMANLATSADLHGRLKAVEAATGLDGDAVKREQHYDDLAAKGREMTAGMNAQFAASDEVVKDDIKKEGISPQAAYASRVQELMDDAHKGEPEAPAKMENLLSNAQTDDIAAHKEERKLHDATLFNEAHRDAALRARGARVQPHLPGAFEMAETMNGRHILSTGMRGNIVSDPGLARSSGELIDNSPENLKRRYAERVNKLANRTFHGMAAPEENMSPEPMGPPPPPGLTEADRSQTPGDSGHANDVPKYDTTGFAKKVLELNKKGAALGVEAVKKAPVRAALAATVAGVPMALAAGGKALGNAIAPPKIAPDAEPFTRVPEYDKSNLADVNTATAGGVSAPPPKPSDTVAEPEHGPTPRTWGGAGGSGPSYDANILKLGDERDAAAEARSGQIAENNKSDALVEEGNAGLGADQANKRAEDAAKLALEQRGEADRWIAGASADAKALSNYHENPNHFWESRSTGHKVAGLISIFLGGLASGLRGGPNTVVEMLNKASDDDIAAQRHNYMAQKDSLEAKRSAYGMAMEKYKNSFMADGVVRLAQIDKMLAMSEAAAAHHKGTETDNNHMRLQQDLLDRKTQVLIEMQKAKQAAAMKAQSGGSSLDTALKAWQKHYVETTGKGEDPGSQEQFISGFFGGHVPAPTWGASADRKVAAAEKQSESDQKRTIIVDGKPRLAVNDGVVKDWNEYSHVHDEASRLLAVMNKAKDGDPATYDAARAKLIEVLPQVYGYARGPSMGQIKQTFGPEAIPEYAHWYLPRLSSRADAKLVELGATLRTVDQSTREHTLGQSAAPTIAPSAEANTPKTFKENK